MVSGCGLDSSGLGQGPVYQFLFITSRHCFYIAIPGSQIRHVELHVSTKPLVISFLFTYMMTSLVETCSSTWRTWESGAEIWKHWLDVLLKNWCFWPNIEMLQGPVVVYCEYSLKYWPPGSLQDIEFLHQLHFPRRARCFIELVKVIQLTRIFIWF
jgi:hypothetical protein